MLRCGVACLLLELVFGVIHACNLRDVQFDLASDKTSWSLCKKDVLASKGIYGVNVSVRSFEQDEAYSTDCFKANHVPGTILTNMVENGMFNVSDLFMDQNLEEIPDIHDVGRDYYTYYWRTSINVSLLFKGDAVLDCDIRLILRSVNYRATVFINGHLVSPESPIPGEAGAVGMFHRWSYVLHHGRQEYQKESSDTATIAVLVEPPDFPGQVTGHQGGNHEIAKNAAIQQYAAGWDWIRGTPDRNTGLWDRVYLQTSDPTISIRSVHVQTLTNVTVARPIEADIGVTVDLRYSDTIGDSCLSDKIFVKATAVVQETGESTTFLVDMEKLECDQHVGMDCHVEYVLPPVHMLKPKTWWPHNYGDPHLYHIKVSVQTDCGGKVTARSEQITRFGVRTFSTFVDPHTTGRIFICNGVKIFIQGGNWIGTDQFHRFSTSRARYRNEIELHRRMGLNLLRIWGGGIAERPELYYAADEAGILIWQEFWMTGDNNGRWAGTYETPVNHHVYLACAKDVILMLRNHASLLMWVGGNELYPESKSPPAEIATGLKALISQYDPGRFYLSSSMSNFTKFDPSYAISPKDGPYGYLSPVRFYERNPGAKFVNGTSFRHMKLGFQPEVGSSSTPTYRGIKKFLSKENLKSFPSFNSTKVPPVFDFHNYQSYTDDHGHDHIYAYGAPSNMSEYCFRAQLAQYTQVKGLFEGYARYLWEYYTGMLFWKTQSPWPSFRGFMYDCWLETTGGFWGLRAALEAGQPLHIQLGNWTAATSVVVINKSPQGCNSESYLVSCEWWDLNGKLMSSREYTVRGTELLPQSVYSLNTPGLSFPAETSNGIAYLRMTLGQQDKPKSPLSFNDYVMSDPSKDQNYAALGARRNDSNMMLRLMISCVEVTDSFGVVQVTNANTAVALYITVHMEHDTEHFFYSHQYFTLLPFESKNVSMSRLAFEAKGSGGVKTGRKDVNATIWIDGLNIIPIRHRCTSHAQVEVASEIKK